jgi:hypothetical protein
MDPSKPTCAITAWISSWIRATSLSPMRWISSGLRSVVVLSRTAKAYHSAPPGNLSKPTDSRVFGRYSSAMKARSAR